MLHIKYLGVAIALMLSSSFTPSLTITNTWPLYVAYQSFGCAGSDASVIAGDFNADGLQDVAVSTDTMLCTFLQNPMTHTLNPPTTVPVGFRGFGIAKGDFNDDGLDDLATTNVYSNQLLIWLQEPDHTLTLTQTLATDNTPDAFVVADVNRDSRDDIVVSHANSPSIGVFLQNSNGTMGSLIAYPSSQAGFDDIDAGDLNGDGRIDVAKMNGQGFGNPDLLVYTQTAQNHLGTPVPYAYGLISSGLGALAVGDVTGDGRDDVVLTTGGINVLAQTITGTLAPPEVYVFDTYRGLLESVAIEDVNLDGRNDVIALHGGFEQASVYQQGVAGVLEAYELFPIPYASHYSPLALDISDVNSDGYPDMLLADYGVGLSVLYHSTGDLSLAGSPLFDFSLPGDSVTYTLEIHNSGPLTVTDVIFTDTLPSGFSLLNATPTQGNCIQTGDVRCRIGTLAIGDSVTVTIAATASSAIGLLTNRASVQTLGDAVLSNNSVEIFSINGYPLFLPLIHR